MTEPDGTGGNGTRTQGTSTRPASGRGARPTGGWGPHRSPGAPGRSRDGQRPAKPVDTGLARWLRRQLDPRHGRDARFVMALTGVPTLVAGTLIGLLFGSAEAGLTVAGIIYAAAMVAWASVMLGFLLRKSATKAGRAELKAERERRQDPSVHWMDR